ncbi:hypothetical protein LBMAG41_17370 [Cyanobium sp.]|nr:hypothetical protein LBMAG41_17370 [Cyanobium sp.]
MALLALGDSAQTQQFQDFQLQNGYGSATKATITPGYGATVSAIINITVNTITEQTFNQIINQVKTSNKYQNRSDFKQLVDNSSYASAASSSTGIFGWLLGSGSSSYTNQNSHLTNEINKYTQGDASNDTTVANSVANIMVKNQSQVNVTATVQVTGQLLVPQPTIIAVETSTFKFTDQNGNTSSVTLLNQSPLVPVNPNDSSVSQNTVTPGSKLAMAPIGS